MALHPEEEPAVRAQTQVTFEGTPQDFLGALVAHIQEGMEKRMADVFDSRLMAFTMFGLRPAIFDILHPAATQVGRGRPSEDDL